MRDYICISNKGPSRMLCYHKPNFQSSSRTRYSLEFYAPFYTKELWATRDCIEPCISLRLFILVFCRPEKKEMTEKRMCSATQYCTCDELLPQKGIVGLQYNV